MRTKTVFPSDEIPHLWAHQKQDHARNSAGNLYFRDNKIYSYGSHFCMGNIVKPGVVLFTTRTYSNTTAKHLHAARYAVNHMKIIPVHDPAGTLGDNLRDFKQRLMNELNEATRDIVPKERKLKYQERQVQARANLSSLVRDIEDYLQAVDATEEHVKIVSGSSEDYREFKTVFEAAKDQTKIVDANNTLDRIQKQRNKRLEKEQAERRANAMKELLKWRAGKYVPNSNFYLYDFPVYLRVNGPDRDDEETLYIESSKGARVSYKAGKVLYSMIKAGRDIKGYSLDGYTVIGINGTLKIGCHEIDRKEVERFAKSQGWTK